MSKKPRIAVVVALLALGCAVVAWWWVARERTREKPLVLYGNVDIREVDLAFRQPGRIDKMPYYEGTVVRPGEVLAELDAEPYADRVAAAEAELAQAQAELAKLTSGSRPQEVARAAAAVDEAQAAVLAADREHERQAALIETGASSQKLLEAARSARDRARAALVSARQGLSLAKEGSRTEDVAVGGARFAAAEAALAQARTALRDTRLVAPSHGVLTTRAREPGSMVATSSPVLTLSLQDPVYVRAYVDEARLTKVAPGTPVSIQVDGAARAIEGTVGFVSPRAEFTPKSVETVDLRTDLVYRLRIVVPGAEAARALRQGMPVTVQVHETAAAPQRQPS